MSDTLDLTWGIYRRVYSTLLTQGRRINAVSEFAEMLFIRIIVVADDFGNFRSDPDLLRSEAFPRRSAVTSERIVAGLAELCGGDLIKQYRSGVEVYGHVLGWEDKQPGRKNGRRVQRFPLHPGEPGGFMGNPGESGGIRNNPGATRLNLVPSGAGLGAASGTSTGSSQATTTGGHGGESFSKNGLPCPARTTDDEEAVIQAIMECGLTAEEAAEIIATPEYTLQGIYHAAKRTRSEQASGKLVKSARAYIKHIAGQGLSKAEQAKQNIASRRLELARLSGRRT